MNASFDDIHDALHRHVAHEIQQAAQSHTDDPNESHRSPWMHLAMDFAGHLAMDLISEYVSLNLLSNHAAVDHPPPGAAHGIGVSTGDGFTHQSTAFTCALVSQKMILDQFGVIDPRTGQPVSEAMLVFEATSHGWLSENGTSLGDMANLLELHGIPCHHGHDWQHLVRDLSEGHQVAIAVNSDELWHDSGFKTLLHEILPGHPDHAVVLKGLRVDQHGHVSIVINDPGRSDGAGVEYSLEKFQAALGQGAFHYVATDQAPPNWQHDPQLLGSLVANSAFGYDASAADSRVEQPSTASYSDCVDRMDDSSRLQYLRNL